MRRFLPAVVAVAAALSVAACGSDEPAPASGGGTPDQVKVGVIPILDVAPIYLGKQKGFFTNRQIDLTLESAQGGAAIVPGVVSGQLQFGFSNMVSLLVGQSNDVPIKVVSNGVGSTGQDGKDFGAIVVKADSPYRTAADLVGKKVTVNTLKNIADTAVRASVRKAGGDPATVNMVELPFPDMPAALSAGRVDAIFVVEPFVSIAVGQGGRILASSYVDTAPNLTVAAYFTSQRLVGSNPDLVRRFTEAMKESLAYADSHPDEARDVISTYTEIDPKVIQQLTLPKWPADINRDSVQTLAQLARQDGTLTTEPDVAALLP
jgi:NitT/TauT family transport system substrate-binding protein